MGGLLTLDVLLPIPATAVLASLGMLPDAAGRGHRHAWHICRRHHGFLCAACSTNAARFWLGNRAWNSANVFANQGGWVIASRAGPFSFRNCSAATPASCVCRRANAPAAVRLRAHEFYYAWLGSTDAAQKQTPRTRLKRRNASDSLGSLELVAEETGALSSCAGQPVGDGIPPAVAGTASSK